MFPELRGWRRPFDGVYVDEYQLGDGLFLGATKQQWISPRAIRSRWRIYCAGIRSHVAPTLARSNTTVKHCTPGQTLAPETAFTNTWPFGPQYDVFKVGGKIFMLFTEHHCRPVGEPEAGSLKVPRCNQQIYPSIAPGYHMNKKHWILHAGEDITVSLLSTI